MGAALVLVMWVLAICVQVVLAPLLISAVVTGASLYALGLYLSEAWQVLTVEHTGHPSPVPAPPSPSGASAGASRPPEPAYRSYVLIQVRRDAWVVVRRAGSRLWTDGVKAHRRLLGWMSFDAIVAGFVWPTWFGVIVGTALLAIPLGAAALALAALQLTLVALWAAAWLAAVGVLGFAEYALLLVRRIVVACPHPGCYRRFGLPVYACPAERCKERHWRLVPNRYGALRHACGCGARLPTLMVLGRYRLAAYCPHCRLRLPGRSGRVRVEHVPIVGGPDAGKTTFLCLTVNALRKGLTEKGGAADFVDARDERIIVGAADRLKRGERLNKTAVELPRAVMLDVQTNADDARILYLFDPAGEYYAASTMVDSQRYLDHARVAVVVVDPLAIPEVERGFSAADRRVVSRAAPANQVGVVRESPGDTVDRLVAALRGRPRNRQLRRLLVVVTKSDVLRRTSVGAALGEPTSDVCGWLTGVGWGNWTRALDGCASQVRYLASGLDVAEATFAEQVAWLTGLRTDNARGTARRRSRRSPWVSESRPRLIPHGYRTGRLALLILGGVSAIGAVTAAVWTMVAGLVGVY